MILMHALLLLGSCYFSHICERLIQGSNKYDVARHMFRGKKAVSFCLLRLIMGTDILVARHLNSGVQ